MGAEMSTAVRIPPTTRSLGGLGYGHEAGPDDSRGACQGASHQAKDVIWPQRVSAGRYAVIEKPRCHTVAANVIPTKLLTEWLFRDLASSEVDIKDLTHVTTRHLTLLISCFSDFVPSLDLSSAISPSHWFTVD